MLRHIPYRYAGWIAALLVLAAITACGSSAGTPNRANPPSNAPTVSRPGPATPAGTVPSSGNPAVLKAVMAQSVQAETYAPVGVVTAYSPTQTTFHAVVTIANATDETRVKAVWTAVDVSPAIAPNTKLDEAEYKVGDIQYKDASTTRNMDLTLEPNSGTFPPGSYKVDIYLNGNLDRTLAFSVDHGAAQATSAPPPAAAPTIGAANSPKPSGLIKQVTLAKGTKGTSRDPENPTTTFSPNSIVHAVVAIQDAPAKTKFHAAWYVIDVGSVAPPNTLVAETDLIANGSRNLDFDLSPKGKFPEGRYRVEISVNGALDQVLNFTVKQ